MFKKIDIKLEILKSTKGIFRWTAVDLVFPLVSFASISVPTVAE